MTYVEDYQGFQLKLAVAINTWWGHQFIWDLVCLLSGRFLYKTHETMIHGQVRPWYKKAIITPTVLLRCYVVVQVLHTFYVVRWFYLILDPLVRFLVYIWFDDLISVAATCCFIACAKSEERFYEFVFRAWKKSTQQM